MTDPPTVPGLPFAVRASATSAWRFEEERHELVAVAPARSDLYVDPLGADSGAALPVVSATTLLGRPAIRDFQFRARVSVAFETQYDAGGLLVWIDERNWAKLCFEFSPDAEPMVVTVVTRGVSDDANAFAVDGRSVWLRISRIGPAYAFHASVDGTRWRLARVFTLGDALGDHRIGFEAQSPTGDGCTVTFDQIGSEEARLGDLRNGS